MSDSLIPIPQHIDSFVRTEEPKPAPLDERLQIASTQMQSIAIKVGNHQYYNTHELALLFRVPEYHIKRLVRDESNNLHGQKVGKAYIIDGESWYNFIMSGKFDHEVRKHRRHDIEVDLQISRDYLQHREDQGL